MTEYNDRAKFLKIFHSLYHGIPGFQKRGCYQERRNQTDQALDFQTWAGFYIQYQFTGVEIRKVIFIFSPLAFRSTKFWHEEPVVYGHKENILIDKKATLLRSKPPS